VTLALERCRGRLRSHPNHVMGWNAESHQSAPVSAGVEPSWLASQLGDRIETLLRHYARRIGGERDKNELEKIEKLGIRW
jgi:hypothetical protein